MRLKEIRTQKGMTTYELASYCGLSQASIVGYESGRCTPNPDTLVKMSEALDCTVDEILKDQKEVINE